MADTTQVAETVPTTRLVMSARDGVRVFIAGAIVGLITIALFAMLDKYVFTPTLCNQAASAVGRCSNKLYFASGLAMILAALFGLFATVQQRVFRPLLVVLFVTVGLWNIVLLMVALPWWAAAISAAILFGLAYLAFAWLVQIRNFVIALVIGIVLVALMRFLIVS